MNVMECGSYLSISGNLLMTLLSSSLLSLLLYSAYVANTEPSASKPTKNRESKTDMKTALFRQLISKICSPHS